MSAKVERWNKESAVAISNGISRAYLIPVKVKQLARQLITELHGNKSTTYRLFALFIYLALRENLSTISQIIIDRDYTGNEIEGTIKSLLLHILRHDKNNVKAGFIHFANVKASRADIVARQVFQQQVSPVRVIHWPEVEAVIRRK